MALVQIKFRYWTGLRSALFRNARLRGSFDKSGRYCDNWNEVPMTAVVAEDGCQAFDVTVSLNATEIGKEFHWGVVLDGPSGTSIWGIPTEAPDVRSSDRHRAFRLEANTPRQDYYLTLGRRLGARKHYSCGITSPDLVFAVWAPNAQKVEVVFSQRTRGYIADDGSGIDSSLPVVELNPLADGVWQSAPLSEFSAFEGAPYMYRITNEQGNIRYRTDLFSRSQIGRGDVNPASDTWDGTLATLDGGKSCSVVVSQDTVASELDTPGNRISREQFWATEFTSGRALPTRIEDLVIYELHVGALGFGQALPGNLRRAIALLDHLESLGVNAVELLPLSEFSGQYGWGYGDTHHFVIESSAGGLDHYKHFVRECHRRGIVVIQDVCYNHFDSDAERAEWQYDSDLPEHNICYWYDGKSADYLEPDRGYLDNGSSGCSPRYWEEIVRHLFVSSAAMLLDECHVDGLRVDLTQAIHRDQSRRRDRKHDGTDSGSFGISDANVYGSKMLREWSRTLRMIRPNVFLIAEDHAEWDGVTRSTDNGGLGFAATWYAAFYHNLIGDSDMAGGRARLLRSAGYGGDEPLDLFQFAGALHATQYNRIVYHESHDEAGNSGGSTRTMVTSVAGAPNVGLTRRCAEARSRLCAGLSLLSAGTPMFFMAEEIAAQKPYRYDDFRDHREDIVGERLGQGAMMFQFYRDLIRLSRKRPAIRSQNIDIIHVNPNGRVIAFTRRTGSDDLLVVASFKNQPYVDGYIVRTDPSRLPNGSWRELFNSDACDYGGTGVGNYGASIPVFGGYLQARLPANGFLVFWRT